MFEHKKQKNKRTSRQLQGVHKTDRKQVRRALAI